MKLFHRFHVSFNNQHIDIALAVASTCYCIIIINTYCCVLTCIPIHFPAEKTPGQNLGGYHHREIVEKGIEMEPNVVYAKAKDLIMEPSVVYGLVAED